MAFGGEDFPEKYASVPKHYSKPDICSKPKNYICTQGERPRPQLLALYSALQVLGLPSRREPSRCFGYLIFPLDAMRNFQAISSQPFLSSSFRGLMQRGCAFGSSEANDPSASVKDTNGEID
jgi:hypothetical protein